VASQLTSVRHETGAANRLLGGVVGVEERQHGQRGPHKNVLPAREVDDEVLAEPAPLSVGEDLLVDVAVGQHAGPLHDPGGAGAFPTVPEPEGVQATRLVPRLLLDELRGWTSRGGAKG
jgi:hypothetical protein